METTLPPSPVDENNRHDRNAIVARLQASEIFRDYQRAFQALTGLPLSLRAAGAFQPPMQGTKRINAFCTLMAGKNKTCAACLLSQQQLETAATEKPGTLACFAGLNESAVPIRIGETVVAYLQTGQVLFRAASPAAARKAASQASQLDRSLDRARLEVAYRETRVVDRSQYESILQLLEIFAQQLAALTNQLMVKQSIDEAPSVTRARSYIAAHLTEDISLDRIARACGMSSFYFCKNFKRGTGLTFTDYLSRTRVEAVKQILLNPYKRVSEAAYEAGFQSLSQFNRVFHRVAGQPPSEYREQLHATVPSSTGSRERIRAA